MMNHDVFCGFNCCFTMISVKLISDGNTCCITVLFPA